jgi:hypothetical protein
VQGANHEDEQMAKPRVFISFDVDNDADAKMLLAGQALNDDSPFDFKDSSVKEHLPGDWKAKVRARMDSIDVVVFLCGAKTNMATGVAHELEIAREKKKTYFMLAAYKDKVCTLPSNATANDKLYKWTWDNLKTLIGGGR